MCEVLSPSWTFLQDQWRDPRVDCRAPITITGVHSAKQEKAFAYFSPGRNFAAVSRLDLSSGAGTRATPWPGSTGATEQLLSIGAAAAGGCLLLLLLLRFNVSIFWTMSGAVLPRRAARPVHVPPRASRHTAGMHSLSARNHLCLPVAHSKHYCCRWLRAMLPHNHMLPPSWAVGTTFV